MSSTGWTHIHIESYCMYDCCHKKKEYYYTLTDLKDITKKGKPEYKKNPAYIKGSRPAWCIKKFGKGKRTPQFKCLCDDNNKRCPFFAMTDSERYEYILFDMAYHLMDLTYDEDKNYDFNKNKWNVMMADFGKYVLSNIEKKK